MEKGKEYYLRYRHREFYGGDWIRTAVRVHLTDAVAQNISVEWPKTLHSIALRELQLVETKSNVVYEQQDIILEGVTEGEFIYI